MGRDARLVQETLAEESIQSISCVDVSCISQTLQERPLGVLVLVEETLTPASMTELASLLLPRAPWSDLPIILLTRSTVPTKSSLERFKKMQQMGSVTLLERPIRRVTLKAAVHAGLASRRRQYETRDLIDQLAQANLDLQQFAFAASHDLREPLRMVNSFSQLLIEKHIDPANKTAQEFGRFIKTGVQRMEDLLRDLLAYSQVVHGGAKVGRSVICLETLVEQAQEFIQEDLDAKGGKLTCGVLPCLNVNSSEIVSVFQNLVSNAIKYAQPSVPPLIEITAQESTAEYMIRVSDNGIGFEQSYSDLVFQLFQRLHNDRSISGTGLGLSICRRIIEKHEGRIWAESLPGTGSSFFFTLPKT